jgi:hypothetical protein
MILDSALDEVNCCPDTPVPYESAVSPTVLTSIFRHVWGFVGGFHESEREIEPVISPVSDYPDHLVDPTSGHPALSTSLDDDDSISSPGPHCKRAP